MGSDLRHSLPSGPYWRINGLERPSVGIATGYITDVDDKCLHQRGNHRNQRPILHNRQFLSRFFNRYSSNPDALANGFYYLENLQPEGSYTMDVSVPRLLSGKPANNPSKRLPFTFTGMLSWYPAFLLSVVSTLPQSDADNFDRRELIQITFSRQVLASSLENQIFVHDRRVGFHLHPAARVVILKLLPRIWTMTPNTESPWARESKIWPVIRSTVTEMVPGEGVEEKKKKRGPPPVIHVCI